MSSVAFRYWLQEKWYEHLDELEAWGKVVPDYQIREYFAKYRWWLRREYRHQVKSQGVSHE